MLSIPIPKVKHKIRILQWGLENGPDGMDAIRASIALVAMSTCSTAGCRNIFGSDQGRRMGARACGGALADLRKVFGEGFEELFEITNTAIRLRHSRITLENGRQAGECLEGIK